MAGPHWFEGGSDDDFGNSLNWDTLAVPLNGEAWGMNHLAQRAIGSGLNQAAKTFSRVVFHPSSRYGINGTLLCNITELRWGASGPQAIISGTVTNTVCDSPGRSAPGLTLNANFTRIEILAGLVKLIGTRTAAAGSRIIVDGRSSGSNEDAQLDIAAATVDLTTNDTKVKLIRGTIQTIAGVDWLSQKGGVFKLGRPLQVDPDTAALLYAECDGGEFQWNSSGQITEIHWGGDHRFGVGNSDLVRTLVTGDMNGECAVDLSGAHNLSITNPIRVNGGTLLAPAGRTLALSG